MRGWLFWFGLVWGFFGGLGLGCILMQAEQAREWFHDVSLVEERKVVSPLSVVACVSASCSAWSNWPLLSCPLCWLVLLSSVMCWVNQLCVCGVSQDINPKEIFIFFFSCGLAFYWSCCTTLYPQIQCRVGSGNVLLGPGTRGVRRGERPLLWAVNHH